MGKRRTLFIIGKVWPEPDSSAAGSRMMQIIDLFQEKNWRVVFASAATESEFAVDLDRKEIETVAVKLNDISIEQTISRITPEIVPLERFTTQEQFGWRNAEFSPRSLRLLDTVDLHSLRLARQEALQKDERFTMDRIREADVAKREIASIYRCDLTLMISEAEMEFLVDVFFIHRNLIYYLSFLVVEYSSRTASSLCHPYNQREDFVTIATFLHPPNLDSVLWLKQEIWPFIRKHVPDSRFHIYGAYPSQRVLQLHNEREGLLVHGRAGSAQEVVQKAKVLLAPLRFGAGLKGKLLDAMRWGTPTVTTEIGAEGMAWKGLWNGVIANGAEEIAEAAAALYKERTLWKQAQATGFQILTNQFSRERFATDFLDTVEERIRGLSAFRSENFVGQMLLHHTISGTKYMARWIEEKNRM